MTEYEYCRLFEGDEGELHVGYFDRDPVEGAGHRPRLIERLGLRRAPDPEADQTHEALERLEKEGWIPAGEIPAGDADGAFERYYRRLSA
jgi:hypothetical protein